MTVFALWFDSNKEQHYPFLGTRVIRGSRFLMIFTTRVNSYIGTTIVVPDKHAVRTNHQLKGVPTAALRAFLFAKVSIISLKSSCFANSDSTANVPKEVNRIWHIVDRR